MFNLYIIKIFKNNLDKNKTLEIPINNFKILLNTHCLYIYNTLTNTTIK